MKIYTSLIVATISVLGLHMETAAMGDQVTLLTNDKQQFFLSKADAELFGTIKDVLSDVGGTDAIPLGNVSATVLQRLIDDLPWARSIRFDPLYQDQRLEERAQRAARALPEPAYVYSAQGIRTTFENLKAANYLQIPELIERYARIIAGMLLSDTSLELLHTNNPDHIKFIQSIEPLDGAADKKWYTENRNAGAFHLLARLIHNYIPRDTSAEQSTLTGHTDQINTAAFSPDGSKVVTGSHDKTVRIWNVMTGILEHELKGHTQAVTSVVFSPDGTHIATASRDNTVRIWNSDNGFFVRELQGHTAPVLSVDFSPNGTHIATASRDNTIRIWNTDDGIFVRELKGHTAPVESVAFSPDSNQIASASHDKTVRIWDTNDGTLLHTLLGHTAVVNSVEYSHDGTKVVSASNDGTARIWNSNTGRSLHSTRVQESSRDINNPGEKRINHVKSATFSPNDQMIITAAVEAGHDEVTRQKNHVTARAWDANSGLPWRTAEGNQLVFISNNEIGEDPSSTAVVISPDGKKLAITLLHSNTTRIWILLPMESFDQSLLVHVLQWAQRTGKSAAWDTKWAKSVMQTYNPDDLALIKKYFSVSRVSVLNKVRALFKSSSSSSSSSSRK
jgi:WD40 repeat protein